MVILTNINDWMLGQSWQIALLVSVVACLSWVLRHRSAHVRYLLWLIVLAKCVFPALYTVPLAILPERAELAEEVVVVEEPVVAEEYKAGGIAVDMVEVIPSAPVYMPPMVTSLEVVTPQEPKGPSIAEKLSVLQWQQWAGIIWISGVVLYLLAAMFKAWRTNCWLRRERKELIGDMRKGVEELFNGLGVSKMPKVWLIEGIGQPFVWGLVRGDIYLPRGFRRFDNGKSRRSVLAHELSHVLRYDAVVNLLQIVVQGFYWFHPFVWCANKRIRAEREKCCDEMAIARLDALPKDYGRAIVHTLVAECKRGRAVPSLAIAGPVKNIEDRIKTIMRSGKRFYHRPTFVTVASILLLTAIIVPTTLALTTRQSENNEVVVEKDGYSISGRLFDKPGGKGVGGVTVTSPWDSRLASAVTAEDGSYSISGIKPRSYWLTPVHGPGVWTDWVMVDVKDGDVTDMQVYMTLPQSISVTTRDAKTGKPVAGAEITISAGIGNSDRDAVVTNTSGKFLLYVRPREVTLTCSGAPGYCVLDDKGREVESVEKKIMVRPDMEVKNVDFKFRWAPVFWGEVLYPDGTPVQDVTFHAGVFMDGGRGYPPPVISFTISGRSFTVKTDKEGKFAGGFRVNGRMPGVGREPTPREIMSQVSRARGMDKLELFSDLVKIEGGALTEIEGVVWVPLRSMGMGFRAEPDKSGQKFKPLKIVLGQCGTARVRVLDPKGKPFSRAWVSATGNPGNQGDSSPHWNGEMEYVGDGRYVMRKLIPGVRYNLNVHTASGLWQTEQFILEPGQVRDVNTVTVQWVGEYLDKLVHNATKGIDDGDAYERQMSAYFLGQMGDEASRAVEQLIAQLEIDEVADVRYRIVEALGRIGDERALEAVRKALNDEDAKVRKAAAEAVKQIETKNISAGEVSWGEAVDGLQMGIILDGGKQIYRKGEMISLQVYVSNTTEKEVPLSYEELDRWFPRILDLEGQSVMQSTGQPLMYTMHLLGGTGSWKEERIVLGPGDIKMLGKSQLQIEPCKSRVEHSAPIEPGKYMVRQGAKFGYIATTGPSWKGTLTSGDLTITVEDDDERVESEAFIAEILGEKIYSNEIEPSAKLLDKYKLEYSEKQFDQWLRQYRESQLRGIIFRPLLEKYADENNVAVINAEIEQFHDAMQQAMEKQSAEWKQWTIELAKELESEDLDEQRRKEIEAKIEQVNKLLENRERRKRDTRVDGPARMFIKAWKVNSLLFEKYQGRVVFQQGGPEPLDAYRKFLQEQEKAGRFQIKDKETADIFWNYFTNDKMHTFFSDQTEAEEAMQRPWWLSDMPPAEKALVDSKPIGRGVPLEDVLGSAAGDSDDDVRLILGLAEGEADPCYADVPKLLCKMKRRTNFGRRHIPTQRIKKLYRRRLAMEPDAELAWALATIIQNGLVGTHLQWAAPTDRGSGRQRREDPAENFSTLARVLEVGFVYSDDSSELRRKFGVGLAKLRLLQGHWQGMNVALEALGKKPIPEDRRPWLCAPPIEWGAELDSQWAAADESMRSGNCDLEFRIEKDGKGVKGAHVLVKKAPEPVIDYDTGIPIDTLFFMPYPLNVYGPYGSFGYKGLDRKQTRYAVSDESGVVRFEKLPHIPIKIEVMVPTSNFEETVRQWELVMEVEPGKFKIAKKYGEGAIDTLTLPAVVELKEGKTVHYPKLVVKRASESKEKGWKTEFEKAAHIDPLKDAMPLAAKNLPGSKISVAQALSGQRHAFAVVCEIIGEADRLSSDMGVVQVEQKFRFAEMLNNPMSFAGEATLRYKLAEPSLYDKAERMIDKGERIIWIMRTRRDGGYKGIKALTDTPANRQRIRTAVQASIVAVTDNESSWGEAKDGLRCRWIQHEGPIVAGSEVILAVEVENTSTDPIIWECQNEITWGMAESISSGGAMPKFHVEVQDGAREATQKEVSGQFGVGLGHKLYQADAVMPGYYYLGPGGKLRLIRDNLWKLHKKGKYQMQCDLARYDLMAGIIWGPKGVMNCPVLEVEVVAEDATSVEGTDDGKWIMEKDFALGKTLLGLRAAEEGEKGDYINLKYVNFHVPKPEVTWLKNFGGDNGFGLSAFMRVDERLLKDGGWLVRLELLDGSGRTIALSERRLGDRALGSTIVTFSLGAATNASIAKRFRATIEQLEQNRAESITGPFSTDYAHFVRLSCDAEEPYERVPNIIEQMVVRFETAPSGMLVAIIRGRSLHVANTEWLMGLKLFDDKGQLLGGSSSISKTYQKKKYRPHSSDLPRPSDEEIRMSLGRAEEFSSASQFRLSVEPIPEASGESGEPLMYGMHQGWSEAVGGVSVLVSPRRVTISDGLPVVLYVDVRNTGTEDRRISLAGSRVGVEKRASGHYGIASGSLPKIATESNWYDMLFSGAVTPFDQGMLIKAGETVEGLEVVLDESWGRFEVDPLTVGGMSPRLSLKIDSNCRVQFGLLVAGINEQGKTDFESSVYVYGEPVDVELTSAVAVKPEAQWGQAVEGVKVRLDVKKRAWKVDETLSLMPSVHADGFRILTLHTDMGLPPTELEVDGKWYQWDTQYLTETRPSPCVFGTRVKDYKSDFLVHDYFWLGKGTNERLKLKPGKHKIRIALTMEPRDSGSKVRAVSNPVEIEILGKSSQRKSKRWGTLTEAGIRLRGATGFKKRKKLEYLGLDLADAERTSKRAKLVDLFEEKPAGSGSYELREEVVVRRHADHWESGIVYHVPSKNVYYIIKEPDHPGSGSRTFYGPFEGDPWKRFGIETPRKERKAHALAIYLVVDPVDVDHPEQVELEKLRLASESILTDKDIIEYDWAKHSVKLTSAARQLIPSPKSVWGLPFVVVADGQRCYMGSFMSLGSSYGPKMPVISSYSYAAEKDAISIDAAWFGDADDPRGDIRIRNALEKAGLVEPVVKVRSSAEVEKILQRSVDLSMLKAEMSIEEALVHLKNSVDPPLIIVVMWGDVQANSDVESSTAIGVGGLSDVPLSLALELLLKSVSGDGGQLAYVVKDGIIVIATKENLPKIMETRVYDGVGFHTPQNETESHIAAVGDSS